jgi:hypothetical protein
LDQAKKLNNYCFYRFLEKRNKKPEVKKHYEYCCTPAPSLINFTMLPAPSYITPLTSRQRNEMGEVLIAGNKIGLVKEFISSKINLLQLSDGLIARGGRPC